MNNRRTVKMIAQLKVTSADQSENMRGFDVAWLRAKELPLPVQIRFMGFVRID